MTNFTAIIGTQRTGTTVLRSIIDSHPDTYCYGEVFYSRHAHQEDCFYYYLKERVREDINYCVPSRDRNEILLRGYLDRLAELSEYQKRVVFDCKYDFLCGALETGMRKPSQEPFLASKFREFGVSVIHLTRKNTLAIYVSSLLSMKNRKWATSDPESLKVTSVHVPTDGLLKRLEGREIEMKEMDTILSKNMNILRLSYEDLFDGDAVDDDALVSISRHLELPDKFSRTTKLKKMAPPLHIAIENIKDVEDTLRGSGYEWCLEY